MDRLKSMEVFSRVVEAGSFAAAAEQMAMSRAMASKHVMELEDRLGVKLLNRTTRRLSLTEGGRMFVDRAREILAAIEELETTVTSQQVDPKGVLRVNAPMTFGRLHVAPALPDYCQRYPKVSVEITFNDRQIDLVEEGVDVAIRIGALQDSSMIARKLGETRMVVCAAPAYLETAPKLDDPEDLKDHNCLIYTLWSQVSDWVLEGVGGRRTVRVDGNLRTNNGETISEAAVAGMGVIIQPSFIVDPHLATGQLVEVLHGWRAPTIGLYAVYSPTKHVSAKIRSFLDFLVERFSTADQWPHANHPLGGVPN